jgi:hypothetical protein
LTAKFGIAYETAALHFNKNASCGGLVCAFSYFVENVSSMFLLKHHQDEESWFEEFKKEHCEFTF